MENIYFTSYTLDGAFEHVSFEQIRKFKNCIARTENSGSEGYYVEVVRWNVKANQYQKFAFCKFLGEEILDLSGLECAKLVTDTLNNTWENDTEPIFHYFKSWDGE